MIEPSLTALIGFPFALYVHRMHYLHHEEHEPVGYKQELWKTSISFFETCLELIASTSHAKVPLKAPQSTGLSRMSSKSYVCLIIKFWLQTFLECTLRLKVSVALSGCEENKIACSEIYEWRRHLNLLLDQKSYLLLSAAVLPIETYILPQF